jgi:PAS domain-containing protein
MRDGNNRVSPPIVRLLALTPSEAEESIDEAIENSGTDKKEAKRAANRRSAQLSRKRKKHFIEDLKEENDDLRRKEQILRSIPDLIVMFNSAGVLGFVSHSVSNFLDFKPSDLEGTSFWQRLCDESVRLLKAAFMDALSARALGMDTAPLGDGLWEVRLKNADGAQKLVTLNGVVHFSGRDPECVCSIRPKEDTGLPPKEDDGEVTESARSDESEEVAIASAFIKPQQSVISFVTDDSSSDNKGKKGARAGKRSAHISDGESMSESCSDRS